MTPATVELGERHGAVVHATEQRVGDGLGLLRDLLLHEARPAALLGSGCVPGDLELLRVGGGAGEVDHLDAVGPDRHDLVLADLHGAAGVLDERGDIRTEEVLALAQTDHERGAAAGADHDAGGVLVHREQGEGAVEPCDAAPHGLGQVARLPVGAADEQRGHLGIGLALEHLTGIRELGLELGEVLDDAVVDEGELAPVAEVRMRIDVGGAAVRRPAGVADAGAAVVDGVLGELVDEHAELAGALAGAELAVARQHGHACGVVAAVFQPLQAPDEHLEAAARADVSHDSAHALDPR